MVAPELVRVPNAEPLPPFTRSQLPELGLSPHRLRGMLASGLVVQPVRGAYLDARCQDDPEARAQAVSLVLPAGMAVARRMAAWMHGVDPRGPGELGAPLDLECVAPAGSSQPRFGAVRGYTATLDESDVVHVRGVPVTSVQRTACDLARYLPSFMGLAILDAMSHRGLVSGEEVLARLDSWNGRRFVARARRVARLCDPGAESFGESWLRLRAVDAGFPTPTTQIRVEKDGRLVYRLDMGWPDHRVAIEYDGEEFHSAYEDRLHDEHRRRHLEVEFDWIVTGVGKAEVLGRSMALERGIGEMLSMEPAIRRRPW